MLVFTKTDWYLSYWYLRLMVVFNFHTGILCTMLVFMHTLNAGIDIDYSIDVVVSCCQITIGSLFRIK